MNRVVNLRALTPGDFGDDESLHAYEHEVEAARRAMTAPFCVAPRQSIRSAATGRILTGGMPIELIDFAGTPDDPAWRVRERLVWQGIVLARG